MAGRLLLLDTASLYYRAFFGLPDSLKAPDGTVVNALRGMVDFTATLVERYEPEAVVACWDDDWRPQWRVDLVDTYKTQRLAEGSADAEETPDLLAPQVPLIAEVLAAAGIAVIGADEAEADDVIGTLVHRWRGPIDVVTGDRDLMQLVDDTQPVRLLYTARGVAKHEVVDDAWVQAKYGVPPSRYVDFAVLRGDASDGLPGVAGIGDKTAAALIAEHGDLDAILAAADDRSVTMRPMVRSSLRDSADYVARAREVVTVRAELDLPDVEPLQALDEQALASLSAFGERWGVESPVGRLVERLSR